MSAIAHNPSGTDLIAPLVLLQLSDLHFARTAASPDVTSSTSPRSVVGRSTRRGIVAAGSWGLVPESGKLLSPDRSAADRGATSSWWTQGALPDRARTHD